MNAVTTLSLSSIVFFLIVSGCGNRTVIRDDNTASDSSVALSKEQMEMAEIETGMIEKKVLSEVVECTGTVEVPPENLVSVSFPLECYIREVHVIPGDYVNKGQVIAMVGHPSLIDLQKSYLEQKSQLEYFREEYKRQGELAVEQAASMKKVQLAESDFKSREIALKSLEEQLKLIGIDPEGLTPETISGVVAIHAIVSGYIRISHANLGKYISPSEEIFEIIDKSHLHLSLEVFEKDLGNVRKGQLIRFHVADKVENMYEATVEVTGQSVNEMDRTIPVHAHIRNPDATLIPGMFVNATLYLSPDTVFAVPVTSLSRDENNYYIFRKVGDRFFKTLVNIGIERDGYAELIHPSQNLILDTIVTRGAYYIASEEKAGN